MCSLLFATAAIAQNSWVMNKSSIKNLPDSVVLRDHVEILSDTTFEGRGRGTKGYSETIFYIVSQFRSAGLLPINGVYTYTFSWGEGETGRNVMGLLEGSKEDNKDKYIIVGAHFDNLGIIADRYYPGADSNASGVAAMIEIAKTLRKQRKEYQSYRGNILFVAFDAFHDGRQGSKALWKAIEKGELKDPVTGRTITPSKVSMMVDIDQIGASIKPVHPERPDYIIAIGENTLGQSRRGVLAHCNEYYGINLDICYTYYGSPKFTDTFYRLGDRGVFVEKGIPVMYFTSGITDLNNKVEDTAQTLNYTVFQKRTILIMRFLEKML